MSEPANDTLMVSIKEAARLLGLSRPTIYALVNNGELKTRRIGRRRMIARSVLEAFVKRDHSTEEGETTA